MNTVAVRRGWDDELLHGRPVVGGAGDASMPPSIAPCHCFILTNSALILPKLPEPLKMGKGESPGRDDPRLELISSSIRVIPDFPKV